jgi:hypothetical protein
MCANLQRTNLSPGTKHNLVWVREEVEIIIYITVVMNSWVIHSGHVWQSRDQTLRRRCSGSALRACTVSGYLSSVTSLSRWVQNALMANVDSEPLPTLRDEYSVDVSGTVCSRFRRFDGGCTNDGAGSARRLDIVISKRNLSSSNMLRARLASKIIANKSPRAFASTWATVPAGPPDPILGARRADRDFDFANLRYRRH